MNDDDLQLSPRTRATDLLSWAAEQGHAPGRAPVPEGTLRAVLTLLELGDGRMHDGYPELSSPVIEQLLYERLYMYVQPADEPEAFGRAVQLLIDHQRAARRLNAKRYERMQAEAEWQGELLCGLLRQPHLVTWPRLYAMVLRADGVDTTDLAAVRAWLDAFRELSDDQRVSAFEALETLGVLDRVESDGGWGHSRLLSIGMATDGARLLLENRLMQRSYRNLAGLNALGRPMPAELSGDFDGLEAAVSAEALRLCGEWTVAGLPALLVGEYADLAPEPDVETYLANESGTPEV